MEIKLAKRSLYNLLEVAAERREPIITELKHSFLMIHLNDMLLLCQMLFCL